MLAAGDGFAGEHGSAGAEEGVEAALPAPELLEQDVAEGIVGFEEGEGLGEGVDACGFADGAVAGDAHGDGSADELGEARGAVGLDLRLLGRLRAVKGEAFVVGEVGLGGEAVDGHVDMSDAVGVHFDHFLSEVAGERAGAGARVEAEEIGTVFGAGRGFALGSSGIRGERRGFALLRDGEA